MFFHRNPAPELLNVELLNQETGRRTYAPSMNNEWHTMPGGVWHCRGTGRQEHGAKNVILHALISAGMLFEHIPKVEIYMTGNGRIVTSRNLPASLRSCDGGEERC